MADRGGCRTRAGRGITYVATTGLATAEHPAAQRLASKPTPPAVVTATPADGAMVAPDTQVQITTSGGTLTQVTVASGDSAVTGQYGPGDEFVGGWGLKPATSYTVTAVATNSKGAATTEVTHFTTKSAARVLQISSITPDSGETVGVGMPIIVGAVLLWNGFGGFPIDLAPGGFEGQLTIPVFMLSEADSVALANAISPSPPAWNAVNVNATIIAVPSRVPVFSDSMADFSSEGPARLTSDLKPDITAPGVNITSAGVGTGTGSLTISGTSMATPHVAGAAILLRQLHPTWSPAQIKALLMDQAVRNMKNNDLSTPVPATVMGSGRVDAFASATAVSLAAPGSLSFGFDPTAVTRSAVRSFKVRNFDGTRTPTR